MLRYILYFDEKQDLCQNRTDETHSSPVVLRTTPGPRVIRVHTSDGRLLYFSGTDGLPERTRDTLTTHVRLDVGKEVRKYFILKRNP